MEANTSQPDGQLLVLLAAYSESLRIAEANRGVIWLKRSDGRVGRRLRLPRAFWLVRVLVLQHVAGSVDVLKRRCYTDAALGCDGERAERNVAVLERWERSLPKVRSNRGAAVLVAVGTFLVSYAIAASLLYGGGQAEFLGALTTGTLELDRGKVVDAFARADLPFAPAVAAVTVILGSLWIVLLVPISAFGIKRALFNLYPTARERLRDYSIAAQAAGTGGIYATEARTFASFDATPPREFPLDLLGRSLPVLIVPLTSIVALGGSEGDLSVFGLVAWSFLMSAGALGLILNRFRRRARMPTPAMDDARDTRAPLTLRIAYGLTMATLIYFLAVFTALAFCTDASC